MKNLLRWLMCALLVRVLFPKDDFDYERYESNDDINRISDPARRC